MKDNNYGIYMFMMVLLKTFLGVNKCYNPFVGLDPSVFSKIMTYEYFFCYIF